MSTDFKITVGIILIVAGIFFYITNKPNTALTPEESAKATKAASRAKIKPRDNAAPAPSPAPGSDAATDGAAPTEMP